MLEAWQTSWFYKTKNSLKKKARNENGHSLKEASTHGELQGIIFYKTPKEVQYNYEYNKMSQLVMS